MSFTPFWERITRLLQLVKWKNLKKNYWEINKLSLKKKYLYNKKIWLQSNNAKQVYKIVGVSCNKHKAIYLSGQKNDIILWSFGGVMT